MTSESRTAVGLPGWSEWLSSPETSALAGRRKFLMGRYLACDREIDRLEGQLTKVRRLQWEYAQTLQLLTRSQAAGQRRANAEIN